MNKTYIDKALSQKEIVRSLQTIFKKETFTKFLKALDDYELIQEGDKIAVGMSGGKDSLILALMLKTLQKFSRVKYDLVFIGMDPGYSKENRTKLEDICSYLDIDLQVFETDIFEIVGTIAKESPCYLCARMRRGSLYGKAKELGCNKLALGHHFNDVIETIMLNILWTGSYKTMMPKLKSENYEGLELIRPLYLIEEKDIISWIEYTGIIPMDEACPIMEKRLDSQRDNIKKLIEDMKAHNPAVEKNIFKSAQNVSLDQVIAYKKEGEVHSFLDEYNKKTR